MFGVMSLINSERMALVLKKLKRFVGFEYLKYVLV